MPISPENMNHSSVITVGVVVLSLVWYFAGAWRHYHGPQSNLASSADSKDVDGVRIDEDLKEKA